MGRKGEGVDAGVGVGGGGEGGGEGEAKARAARVGLVDRGQVGVERVDEVVQGDCAAGVGVWDEGIGGG